MANFQRTQTKAKTTGNAAPPVTTTTATTATAKPSSSAVAQRAYELWEQSGHQHGKDQEHWFQAERELRARTARN